jgi:SpoVK/Ycf46/Vps4 family AAA+-type ATPase
MNAPTSPASIDLQQILRDAEVQPVIDQLENELIGLAPVKARIREIAAFLVVSRARAAMGLEAATPSLHMCFTGNPGTGKTTVALRMAEILHRLGYVRKGHVVSVTRDDLVGQYIGHTAPKTKEILKKAMGGVLFIDEAYYLYRPENERDYGQEAIEILDTFFQSNPGMSSRIAHHIDFPDYGEPELLQIAGKMVGAMNYRFDDEASKAMDEYIHLRRQQPHFANARSIRNALDRARLRQANRLFQLAMEGSVSVTADDLSTLSGADIRASRVFTGGLAEKK